MQVEKISTRQLNKVYASGKDIYTPIKETIRK